jgi:hypothetical protein
MVGKLFNGVESLQRLHILKYDDRMIIHSIPEVSACTPSVYSNIQTKLES